MTYRWVIKCITCITSIHLVESLDKSLVESLDKSLVERNSDPDAGK